MNILGRILLGFATVVVALLACIYLLVNSLDNERARSWLFPLVAKYAGYQVDVPGTIDTRLNRFLELQLSKGTLKPVPQEPTSKTDQEEKVQETLALNAEWDSVLVRIDPLELFSWQIGFEKVVVDALKVKVLPAKEQKPEAVAANSTEDSFSLPINIVVNGLNISNTAIFLTNEEGTTEIAFDQLLGSMRMSSDSVPVVASDLKFGSLRLKAPLTLKEGAAEETVEEVADTTIPDGGTDHNVVIKELYSLLEQPPFLIDQITFSADKINAGEWNTHSVESNLVWIENRLEAKVALGKPVSKISVDVDIPARTINLSGDLRHFALGPVVNSVVNFGFLPRSIKKDIFTGYLRAFADIKTQGESTDSFLKNLNGKLYMIVEDGSVDATIVEALGFDIAETAVSLISGNPNTDINCLVADIDIANGVVNGDKIVLETDDSKIKGQGNLNLPEATVDYRLAVQAGDVSPLSVPAPILIKGPLVSPKFSVEKKTLIKEILGTVIQPAEALIAWVKGEEDETPSKSVKRCEALLSL